MRNRISEMPKKKARQRPSHKDTVRILSGDAADRNSMHTVFGGSQLVPVRVHAEYNRHRGAELDHRRLGSRVRDVFRLVTLLAVFYILSLLSSFTFNRMMAVITQGSLKKLRIKMFNGMQDLPVKYFDTNNHGDIMSHYTNDIDTLRQLISQSMPQLLISAVAVTTVVAIMFYYCLWLALVVIAGVCVMLLVTKKVGAVRRVILSGSR